MIDQVFPVGPIPRAEVSIHSGEVRLLEGEPDSIRVVADANEGSGLEVTQRGATVVVTTDKRGWLRSDDADVTLYVPETTQAVINIRIESCTGRGSFSSASGDLQIERCGEGRIKASTASGDVSISMCQSSDVDCKSMSGDVVLGIPPGTRVDLDATTMSGEVRLPEPSKSTKPPDRSMAIKVRLMSGDVRLSRTGEV